MCVVTMSLPREKQFGMCVCVSEV